MAEAVEQAGDIVARWSGKSVEAERIEDELARLRYEAAGRPEQGQAFALRTSFINLVVYANDDETALGASQTIATLSGQHPSRALIVVARPDADEHGIDTSLAAHCHLSPGMEQQVCCEEVTLNVNGPAANHLHSVLAPLLIPDLPVYLWWIGALPHDHHLISEIMASADRFIVDSGRFTKPAEDLRALEHLSSRASRCALGDLNWQRLQPWRQIIAQQFAAPSLEAAKRQVSDVTISFAKNDGDERWSQALLLCGWLSRAFGLDAAEPGVKGLGEFTLRRDGEDVTVHLTPEAHAELDAGEIATVDIRCGGGESATLEITRKPDPLHLRITVRDESGELEERQRTEPGDEAPMLARELGAFTHDPEYHDVLRAALPLIPAIE